MSPSTNGLDEDDRVGYDPTTNTYHNQIAREDSDSLCVTIIMTVSAVTGQEPYAMEPLYSVLDPDALEACILHERKDSVQVSFSYEGCTVTIAGSGEITVQPEK
ncbi:HalOD1 output domain-containing protein [Halopiger aswanensis]|uniref:Halobacterial output domain-containing protein n=1 Tax=Halopiger aswanensis TaxID=148449 RepID=A0A419WPS2_9EURY|nr:HalOD1 output domain-containing protein [Halopiger aswanensis]RKD97418.1 hypothetical protein ATJ93_0404 [Halopiger aswanensis]